MTENVEPAYKKSIGYQAILLGGFATFSAALLILGNISTSDEIEKMILEDTKKSINQVIPENLHDNNLLKDKIRIKHNNQEVMVYRAKLNDQITAVAYQIKGQGYGGEILLILGIKSDGSILGVRVLSHAETPGLGDKIEEKKDPWIFSFNGLSLDNVPASAWSVKKDGGHFDQFSGATITPRAVVYAVKSGLDFFTQHRQALISLTANPPTPSEEKSDQD